MCDLQCTGARWEGFDLDHARAVAYKQACSLAGTHASEEDVRDFQSELVLAALERWPRFDPARGRARAFTAVCISRAATSLHRARSTAKRGGSQHILSLEQCAEDGTELTMHRLRAPSEDDPMRMVDLRQDVACAIERLPLDLQGACRELLAAMDDPRSPGCAPFPDNAAASVRMHFESLGLKEYMP